MADLEKGKLKELSSIDAQEDDELHRRRLDLDLDELNEPDDHDEGDTAYPEDDLPDSRATSPLQDSDVSRKASWSARLKKLIFPAKSSSEDFENFVPRYRYLPILSGIAIPFSILLEIPGLTSRWYVRTDDNRTVETQPNPPLLDIAMGISLFCAISANTALIARFLEWRVGLMTLLCVIFLSIHDTINIVTVVTFGIEHRFSDGFTYGQAYWMTVCSTVASTFTNITLLIDLIWTKNFVVSGSGLTRKQRSLSIIIIFLLVYIAIGALINTFLIADLNFIDSLYFSILVIEAIGFGDVLPVTVGARIFVCFYAVFGLVNLALAVTLIRETVLEALEVGYYKRLQEVRRRRRATTWKRRVIRRWRNAIEWRLTKLHCPIWVEDDDSMEHIISYHYHKLTRWCRAKIEDIAEYFGLSIFMEKGSIVNENGCLADYKHPHLPHPRGMRLNLEVLSKKQLQSAAMEAGVALELLLPVDYWERREERLKDRKNKMGRSLTSFRDPGSPGLLSPPRTHTPVQTSHTIATIPSTSYDLLRQGRQATDASQPGDMPLTHMRMGRMVAMLGNFALAVDNSTHLTGIPLPPVKVQSIVTPLRQESAAPPSGAANPQNSSSYGMFRETVEEEETRAFQSRLLISWFLFLVFWTVGGVIFRATEGWTYAESLYFCVVSFTTIGFGDFSPKTPAGRSIFVAWALFGVGTMTVLISIVAEAYSDRYKNALHSGAFARAVKQYRNRSGHGNILAKKKRNPLPPVMPVGTTHEDISTALAESEQQAKQSLEDLPHQIIKHVRTFHQHFQFFVGPDAKANVGNLSEVPEGLHKLMDDISGTEKLAERIKKEILQDEHARQTLLHIGIERILKRIVDTTEEAINALAERDRLALAHEISLEHSVSTSSKNDQAASAS